MPGRPDDVRSRGAKRKCRSSGATSEFDPSETLSLIVRQEPTIANSWQKMSATTTRRIPLATYYRSTMIPKNGSTPMGYRRVKGQRCSAPFFLHTPAQKFALYSSLHSGGLQPMPRKPQAVKDSFEIAELTEQKTIKDGRRR